MHPKTHQSNHPSSSPLQTLNGLKTLKFSVYCEDLSLHSFSGYLPSIALYTEHNGSYVFNSETEKQAKGLINPIFSKSFSLEYSFELRQNLKFAVKLSKCQDRERILGEAFTTLGRIVGNKEQTVTLDIVSSEKSDEIVGKMVVRIERTSHTQKIAKMRLHAQSLALCKKTYKKTEISLKFRLLDTNFNRMVYESHPSEKETPYWEAFEAELEKLCSGDYQKPIKLQVLNGDSIMGEAFFTIQDLVNTKGRDFPIHLQCPKTRSFAGNITIYHFSILEKPHFLDYVQGGLQLSLLLGIDYAISGGVFETLDSPAKVNSLNEYQKIMKEVFGTLMDYNRYKKVRMFGVGGHQVCSEGSLSPKSNRCFALLDSSSKIYAVDVDGMMDIYKKSLKNTFCGSVSYLEPLITQAIRLAKSVQDTGANEYVVLVILTNGKCNDVQETINALVQASKLPLSVLLVDTGNMSTIEQLIEDINSSKASGEREVTTLVRYSEVGNNPVHLTEHILKKIPRHIVEYMYEYNNILPEPCTPQRIKKKKVVNTFESLGSDIEDDLYNEEKDSNISSFNNRHVNISTPFSKSGGETGWNTPRYSGEDEEDNNDKNHNISTFKRRVQGLKTFAWTHKEIEETSSTRENSRVSIGLRLALQNSSLHFK